MSWTAACGDLEMEKEIYFEVMTPLGVKVRTTKEYWDYIVNFKHRLIKTKENIVKETLLNPDEIYRSKIDQNVYLYPIVALNSAFIIMKPLLMDGRALTQCHSLDHSKGDF